MQGILNCLIVLTPRASKIPFSKISGTLFPEFKCLGYLSFNAAIITTQSPSFVPFLHILYSVWLFFHVCWEKCQNLIQLVKAREEVVHMAGNIYRFHYCLAQFSSCPSLNISSRVFKRGRKFLPYSTIELLLPVHQF